MTSKAHLDFFRNVNESETTSGLDPVEAESDPNAEINPTMDDMNPTANHADFLGNSTTNITIKTTTSQN